MPETGSQEGKTAPEGPAAASAAKPAGSTSVDALKAALGAGTPTTPRPTMLAPITMTRGYHKSMCFYGAQRTGKTHQIRRLIERFGREHVAVLDCDRGLSTIEDLRPQMFELLTAEDYLTLQVNELAERYIRNLDRAWEYVRTHLSDLWWVCMDNSTAYSDWVEDRGDVRMERGDYQSKRQRDDSFAMWRDTAREQLRTIRKYRHLPVNFYINALEEMEREKVYDVRTDTMKESGVAWAEPALSGRKAAIRYPAAWDLVVRCTREVSTNPPGTLFRADTQGDKLVVGGSRIPGSVIIPRYLDMGVLTPAGERIYDPRVHWDIVKIWERVIGMTAEEWISRRREEEGAKIPLDSQPPAPNDRRGP